MSPQLSVLPNEPRVADPAREAGLTDCYLVPALPALEAFFLSLRAGLDAPLSQAQPVKLGKPYPLGQCLEISRAAERCLVHLQRLAFDGAAEQGRQALLAFMQAGGTVRQVWGDLRGEYFQNAFVVGTLYVDVSNDTVFSHKPKVEILPFEQARFVPVADYWHFIRVAQRYWKAQIFPNHILPELAPWFPLIVAAPGGSLRLEAASNYMISLARQSGFTASAAVLAERALDAGLFEVLQGSLADSSQPRARDPQQGRLQALQWCEHYRQQPPTLTPEFATGLIERLQEVNRLWLPLVCGSGLSPEAFEAIGG